MARSRRPNAEKNGCTVSLVHLTIVGEGFYYNLTKLWGHGGAKLHLTAEVAEHISHPLCLGAKSTSDVSLMLSSTRSDEVLTMTDD